MFTLVGSLSESCCLPSDFGSLLTLISGKRVVGLGIFVTGGKERVWLLHKEINTSIGVKVIELMGGW